MVSKFGRVLIADKARVWWPDAMRNAVFCRRSILSIGIAAALAELSLTCAEAAVPFKVIKSWQDSAPEAVDVTIEIVRETSEARRYEDFRKGGWVRISDVTVIAKVDHVYRTASNLQPGDEITLRYRTQRYNPLPPPDGDYGVRLHPGDRAAAYLKRIDDKTYALAGDRGCLNKL